MSSVLATSQRPESPLAGFSFGQIIASVIAALLVASVCGALAAYVTQARTVDRLSTVENTVQQNKAEREQQVKELREHTIPRGEFDAYKETLREIREDVREIRRVQTAGGR